MLALNLSSRKNLYAGSEFKYELSGTGTAQNIRVVGLLRYAFAGGSDRVKTSDCAELLVDADVAEELKEILSNNSPDQIRKALDSLR